MFNNFFFENSVVYEIMWEKGLVRARPQMTNGACALHAGYLGLQMYIQVV